MSELKETALMMYAMVTVDEVSGSLRDNVLEIAKSPDLSPDNKRKLLKRMQAGFNEAIEKALEEIE